jgi:hypothetical protein
MSRHANEHEYTKRQLRSMRGVAERRRKDILRLQGEVAKLKLQAPMQDVLLVLLRLCRSNHELLQELLDKRTETHKVDFDTKGPHQK